MKPGVRPIVVDGVHLVPEYPTYWTVPETCAGAIELMVRGGQVEYEPTFAASDGKLVEQLGVQTTPVNSKPFARKRV